MREVIELEEKTVINQDEAVTRCYEWFDADRRAKADIQDEMVEAYKLYNCDHWSLKDPTGRPLRTEQQKANRPNTVENFAFSLIEGLVSEFTEDVDLIDYPVEPGDEDTAVVMTELKKYLMYKNRLKIAREHYVRNFFLYGTAIWHTYWDPTWKGGRGPNRWVGDVKWDSVHPQALFPDFRCRHNIEDGMRIHKAIPSTVEYIKEHFDVEVTGDTPKDGMSIGEENKRIYDATSEEILLIETWYKGAPLQGDDEGFGMHVIWWAGDGNPTYLHHENYIYYEPDQDPKFPFNFKVRYPRENSVWGYGEAHFLKSPQIVLNKTTELILEGHMHYSLGQTFYRPGAITPKQERYLKRYGTMPNMYFAVNNPDDIRRLYGKGVDASLPGEANRVQRAMEGIVGRHDISQGRTPGSVVAFRALDLLAARARVRLRSAENAIICAYEECGNYVNHLIQQFYTGQRAYRILGDHAAKEEMVTINMETGEERPFVGEIPPGWVLETKTEQMVKYGTFNISDHKKVYIYDNETGFGDTVPFDDGMAEAIAETEMLKEQGEEFDTTIDYEVYCPELDVMCKVSTSAPTDRAFYLEMGKELLMGGLIDEETFWYVLQNGKFPPYETVMRKRRNEMTAVAQHQQEQTEQQMMQQQQQQQQEQAQPPPEMGVAVPPGQPPTPEQPEWDGALIQEVLANNPDLLEKFRNLSPEMQQEVLQQVEAGEMYF